MIPYSHIQSFNAHGDQDDLENKLTAFQNVGWIMIGPTPILTAPFISVGWLREKGDPIYPDAYPKQE